jgi:P4 family phage/plasmid primase-like protien
MSEEKPQKESVLDVATRYIEAGLRVTLVSDPKSGQRDAGKSPILKDWPNRHLTIEEFEKHYRPGMNLGVVTGKVSGLICIDIDPRNGGNVWYEEHKDRLTGAIVERSPSGGFHLYYRYPPGTLSIPSRRGVAGIAPGVEVLADGGSQVVTYPSIHPNHLDADGYKFDYGLDLTDLEAEADFLPSWLHEEVMRQGASFTADTGPGLAEPTTNPANYEKAREVLERLPTAQEGTRDAMCFRAGCICHDFGLPVAKAIELVREYNRAKVVPPLQDEEVSHPVRHAYVYAKSSFGNRTAEAQFDVIEGDVGEPPPAVKKGESDDAQRYVKRRCLHNAEVFLERHGWRLKFLEDEIYWYSTEAKCWTIISGNALRNIISKDIERLSPTLKAFHTTGYVKEVFEMVKISHQHSSDSTTPDKWTNGLEGTFVALRNGILEIETGELLEHSHEFFSFTTLPFDYAPEAKCPEFERFLASIWDDQETRDAMKLWAGYMLIPDMAEQKFAMILGASRGGKGTLASILTELLGERNCASCTLTTLASEFGLSSLVGKRAVFFHDAQKVSGSLGDIATERLKSITGNDPQSINRKNKDYISMKLPVKIVLVCNKVPNFVNSRGAMTNRMIVFPIKKTFHGREDLKLLEKLRKELPGIFNWALEGAKLLQTGARLFQSQTGEEELKEVIEVLEPLAGFTNSGLEVATDPFEGDELDDGDHFISTEDMYEQYKRWCDETGHRAKAFERFASEVKPWLPPGVAYTSRRVNGVVKRGYLNLRLKRKTTYDFN